MMTREVKRIIEAIFPGVKVVPMPDGHLSYCYFHTSYLSGKYGRPPTEFHDEIDKVMNKLLKFSWEEILTSK
jgi:hypothetical protein